MGVRMNTNMNNHFFRQSIAVFASIPLLIWALENAFKRSILKESLSVITILIFCQMIGLFFLSRSYKYAVKTMKMGQMIKLHKMIGYTCVSIMLMHPVFIIMPKLFESGVATAHAFITIITTLNPGVILGITAWPLMLVLAITSLTRNQLPVKYNTWRTFHGILAILFILTAAWHVIDLGRHSSMAMSIFIILLTTGGVLLYLLKILKQPGK